MRGISVPFREQAEFWRRKVNVPTASWRDLQRGDHAHGFMVAGAARLDLLDDLRKAVDKAILDGGTIADFRRNFDAIVARTGWQYQGGRNWRTRIIYTTNVRSAYMAGRWAQIQAIKHRRPFLQYVHNDSVRHPRPEHQSWNGKVLSVDDPWWSTHFPPNGYGCQCTVTTLARRDLDRMGMDGPDAAPTATDDADGLDPGFDYNVGVAASSVPAALRFGQKVMQLPPPWRTQALDDAQRRAADTFADWAIVLRRALTSPATTPLQRPVGFLRPAVVQALTDLPASAVLLADDLALRATAPDLLEALPAWLAAPDTQVWQAPPGSALIFVRRLANGSLVRIRFANSVQGYQLQGAEQIDAATLRRAGYVRLNGES
ncbi:phage minor head protein [Stenotrophomonas sp. B1-1]|uniref:phage head morphogenesis protein n=1 Tax=Stenotrophomonas sp. B1-1 TaxID=2710648 RepID=UPI001F07841C|nr:phage minor head protein [Stenotrophomonas sp. B1-1]